MVSQRFHLTPDIKPDCILITKYRIVIIDFKAYGDRKNDKLVFENNNFRGKWYIDGPLRNRLFFVQAGAESKNRTNPYDQVKEYSKGLLERVFPQNDEYDFTEKTLNKKVRVRGMIKKFNNNYQIELGPNDEVEIL